MAASTVAKQALRMFHPSRHLWIDTVSKTLSHRHLQIGLTERGLEDIGDVTSIQCLIEKGRSVTRGQELLQIHYEGHSITSADELYHTVWETFDDYVTIESPLSGTTEEECGKSQILNNLDEEEIDSDTILVTLTVPEEEWKRGCQEQQLVDEQQYMRLIRSMTRGKFAE
jgi:hypothetical protein